MEQLTKRELEVLEYLAKGHPNKFIAASLEISENTLKTHLKHIFTKLEVPNRTAATTKYILNIQNHSKYHPKG